MTAPVLDITVGISTLDRPAALGRCLDAILAGTTVPAEIVVVDQGRDSADAILSARRTARPALLHVRQSRMGLSAARNSMFEHASQPLVAVTDDDCVPDARWLSAIGEAFSRRPFPDAVSGRVLALPGDNLRTHAVSLRTSEVAEDFTGEHIPWRVGTGANFAARRHLVRALGGYDERLGAGSLGQAAEDVDLALRVLRAGSRIRYDPAAIVYHERQPEARRLATRWSYAHGIGAVAGILGRERDRFAMTMLAAFGRDVLARAARAIRSHDRSALHQAMLSVGGAANGVAYGWRVARRPRRLNRLDTAAS